MDAKAIVELCSHQTKPNPHVVSIFLFHKLLYLHSFPVFVSLKLLEFKIADLL